MQGNQEFREISHRIRNLLHQNQNGVLLRGILYEINLIEHINHTKIILDAFITKILQDSPKDSIIVGHRKLSNALNLLKKSLEIKKIDEIKSPDPIP